MSRSTASPSEPKVPTQLVNERRRAWHAFTKLVLWNCVGLAVFLLLLLLVFKVL